MRSGLARSTSPRWRLVPSSRARWRATSGESRNVVASARLRPSPEANRRRPSRPRSGSGDADSQSRRSGRSCCIIRDDRVRPRVSSATAWRVRSTSVKPNAARRSAVAASPRGPAPESDSSSGRNHTRSWAPRTCSRWAARARSNASVGTGVGCASEPEHPCHSPPIVSVGRHGVDLSLVLELHDVLHAPQEPVGVVEPGGVVGVDVAAAPQVLEGTEGAALPELGIEAAVDELEELHRELDVADAAPARASHHDRLHRASPPAPTEPSGHGRSGDRRRRRARPTGRAPPSAPRPHRARRLRPPAAPSGAPGAPTARAHRSQ